MIAVVMCLSVKVYNENIDAVVLEFEGRGHTHYAGVDISHVSWVSLVQIADISKESSLSGPSVRRTKLQIPSPYSSELLTLVCKVLHDWFHYIQLLPLYFALDTVFLQIFTRLVPFHHSGLSPNITLSYKTVY